MPLPSPKSGAELLDMYYLEIRCHLVETAAAFDRIERARDGAEAQRDPRYVKLVAALDLLASDGTDRAQRFLELFSVNDEEAAK